jgi:hypothetical protein
MGNEIDRRRTRRTDEVQRVYVERTQCYDPLCKRLNNTYKSDIVREKQRKGIGLFVDGCA